MLCLLLREALRWAATPRLRDAVRCLVSLCLAMPLLRAAKQCPALPLLSLALHHITLRSLCRAWLCVAFAEPRVAGPWSAMPLLRAAKRCPALPLLSLGLHHIALRSLC
jgi:hypothetical protein